MNVELSPKAAKYLLKLDPPTRERIKQALKRLSLEPPQGDIKSLSGQNGYRLRIGKYRILFDMTGNEIVVYKIDLRGQIYKKGR